MVIDGLFVYTGSSRGQYLQVPLRRLKLVNFALLQHPFPIDRSSLYAADRGGGGRGE